MSVAARRPETSQPVPAGVPDVAGRVVHRSFRPVIETPRLVLRLHRPTDVTDLVAGVGNIEVARMMARAAHPFTEDHARAWLATASANAVTQRGIRFAITLRGRLIGKVGLSGIPARFGIGYWLARPHWRRGYATEAVRAVIAYAFEVLGARSVRAGVFVDNPASLRVLTKIGFRRIGVRTSLSLARNQRVEHIATVLTRARFRSDRA